MRRFLLEQSMSDEVVPFEPNEEDENGNHIFHISTQSIRVRAKTHVEALRILAMYFVWCVKASTDAELYHKGHGLPLVGDDPAVDHAPPPTATAPLVSDLESFDIFDWAETNKHVVHYNRFPEGT